MQITNKKLLILIVVILGIVGTSYFVIKTKSSRLSVTDAKNEFEYAQSLKQDVEAKPYIAKLPIKTDVYIIIFSSVNKNIVVIFNKSTNSIDNLRQLYSNEINTKLESIGATNVPIEWEMKN